MSKQSDPRLPQDIGKEAISTWSAISSPWGRLFNARDIYEYVCRLQGLYTALFFEAFRILMPDYDERCNMICEYSRKKGEAMWDQPGMESGFAFYNAPPFLGGTCLAGVCGDHGDEMLLTPGRVNDFGAYRVEKELDVCPLAITGSELCRVTTSLLQGIGDGMAHLQKGPSLELNMVEALCCGDLHCRLIAENREKYPLPEAVNKQPMDVYGPIATADKIRCTDEEHLDKEGECLRGDTNFRFESALCQEFTVGESFRDSLHTIIRDFGTIHSNNFIDVAIEQGKFTMDEITNAVRWVFEAAGKAMFIEPFAKDGLRAWLDCPRDINDGRLLGGYIEVILQCLMIPYEVEVFNKQEVVYLIDRDDIANHVPLLPDALVSMWYGMGRSLLGHMYFAWEDKLEDTPDSILRLKIARKIDKRNS
ncbi:MAG: hypothetical protein Q4D39_02785 [Coriobacteriaceae bacterium]|nr:hypothetical protein [Coriobacteriaceae bacterium]